MHDKIKRIAKIWLSPILVSVAKKIKFCAASRGSELYGRFSGFSKAVELDSQKINYQGLLFQRI